MILEIHKILLSMSPILVIASLYDICVRPNAVITNRKSDFIFIWCRICSLIHLHGVIVYLYKGEGISEGDISMAIICITPVIIKYFLVMIKEERIKPYRLDNASYILWEILGASWIIFLRICFLEVQVLEEGGKVKKIKMLELIGLKIYNFVVISVLPMLLTGTLYDIFFRPNAVKANQWTDFIFIWCRIINFTHIYDLIAHVYGGSTRFSREDIYMSIAYILPVYVKYLLILLREERVGSYRIANEEFILLEVVLVVLFTIFRIMFRLYFFGEL